MEDGGVARGHVARGVSHDEPVDRHQREDRLLVSARAGEALSVAGARIAVVDTVEPLVPRMLARGFGHVAVMSSLAGFRGLPNAPAYCASKAAVRVYGEGLRGRLAKDGIGVSVVCPGFIRTPLTAANPFPMPFLMEPAAAAERIVRGLARNRARIAFPHRLYALVLLTSLLPAAVVDGLFSRFAAKE